MCCLQGIHGDVKGLYLQATIPLLPFIQTKKYGNPPIVTPYLLIAMEVSKHILVAMIFEEIIVLVLVIR